MLTTVLGVVGLCLCKYGVYFGFGFGSSIAMSMYVEDCSERLFQGDELK
jgi:hypothetical protein